MSDAKFRECPFCGSNSVTLVEREVHETKLVETGVVCNNCCSTGTPLYLNHGFCENPEETAIAAWNRRAPDWVSVEDALPERKADGDISDDVIVYDAEHKATYQGYCHFYPLSSGHFWVSSLDDLNISGVTHWMPLPEPPAEREGGAK